MKKLFLFFLILYGIHANADSGKPRYAMSMTLPDTNVLSQILALPLQDYIGKPVDSLFNVLPVGFTNRGFLISKLGRSKGVYQSFHTTLANNCAVEIFIDTFQFMTFPNYAQPSTWDMTLAKKETIAFIKVYKENNSVCIYGCDNPQYNW